MEATWEDAIARGDVQRVRALLGRGIDVDARDRYGQTALMLLLTAGADPRLRTRIDDCETPREMAEKAGLREIAERLAGHEARFEQ